MVTLRRVVGISPILAGEFASAITTAGESRNSTFNCGEFNFGSGEEVAEKRSNNKQLDLLEVVITI